MKPAETYKRWIIQTQQVFYVEVWDSDGHHYIAVRNAKSEDEAIEMAKRWIDKYEIQADQLNCIDGFGDLLDNEYEFWAQMYLDP